MEFLTIITPCVRFQNLHEISKTIPDGVRWIVVFDSKEIPDKKYIPKNAECYNHHEPERGYPQSNFGLGKVDYGWVYFLDDDTTLHSNLISEVTKVIKENPEVDFIYFNQVYPNGVKRVGGEVKVKRIDKGNYITRRDLIGNDRFRNCASADGMFAEVLFKKSKTPLYLNKNLSTYNGLRTVEESKFTIIIPTMWYHPLMLKHMVSVYERSEWVAEVLIVNNCEEQRISLPYNKVRIIGTGENMFVNKAWNLAIEHTKTKKVVLANDDVLVNETQLNKLLGILYTQLKPKMVVGPHSNCIPKYKLPFSPKVVVEKGGKSMCAGGGIFICMLKQDYHPVPKELPIWHGDLIQFEVNDYHVFKGVEIKTDMRGTTIKLMTFETEKQGRQQERAFYLQYKTNGYKQFICVHKTLNVLLVFKTGGQYKLKDVTLLANHIIKKCVSVKTNVYCITDFINEETKFANVTLLPMKHLWKGWWSKMNLFSPELESLRPFLYLDLDTVVVRNFMRSLPIGGRLGGFIMLRDFYRPAFPASGVMWFPKNNRKIQVVWKEWEKDPLKWMGVFRGDQDFIGKVIQPDGFWQDFTGGIVTFKPARQRRRLRLNGHEQIICFHGKPKIREVTCKVKWVADYINETV